MRPHVEFVHEDDYVWHSAELPGASGDVVQRNLSVDEETGAASLRIDARSDVQRPAGWHAADTELFVLSGELALGGRAFGEGTYVRAARGVAIPSLSIREGTCLLLYREHGDWGFVPSDQNRPDVSGSVLAKDTAGMDWRPVLSQGKPTGILVKSLYQDANTGGFSGLTWAQPGWRDVRYTHHSVWEECYTLAGRMTYNFGELVAGTYFFRPAWVKHGEFVAEEPDGCHWFIRVGGELVSWFTEGPAVTVGGRAVNYDPQTEAPVLSGIPVRSSRAGEWDGTGR